MPKGKDIKVEDSSFELALGKLDILHSNLVSTKTIFNSLCEDLLEDWEGKSANEGKKAVADLITKFQSCTDNLEVTKKMLNSSYEYLHEADSAIAQGVEEKTIIPK